MNFELECEFCKEKHLLAEEALSEKKIGDLTATILTCPNCQKPKVVQLDNDETLRLLAKYFACATQAIAYKNQHNGKASHKLKAKARKIQAELDDKRELLNKRYSGLFTENADIKEQSELCDQPQEQAGGGTLNV